MTEKTQEKTLAELAPPDHECRLCGYVYETKKGDAKANVPPGTLFSELPSGWKCPVCAAKPNQFVSIGATNAPSAEVASLGGTYAPLDATKFPSAEVPALRRAHAPLTPRVQGRTGGRKF